MNHSSSFLICIVFITFIEIKPVIKVGATSAPTLYEKGETCLSQSIGIRSLIPNIINELKNCRLINGYLIITLFDEIMPDAEFPLLTEITEFLLVFRVGGLRSLGKLFPNLRIIRGNFLINDFSLIIYDVPELQEIGLSSLMKISRGSVRIQKNPSLCFADAIDWTLIASNGTGNIVRDNKDVNECRVCGNEQGDKSKAEVTAYHETLDSLEPLCWNQQSHRVCPSNCGNLTCNLNGECCDKLCVGCSNENPNVCLSCRYFTVGSTSHQRCVRSCPENTFEFENHRCVSKDECYVIRRPRSFQDNRHFLDYPYFPHDGKCLTDCPRDFYADGVSGHRRCIMQMHTDGYIEECPSGTVVSLLTAQQYRNCTHIKGALTINLKNQHIGNIMRELENTLSNIEIIDGPLSIVNSNDLLSLGFFRKLRIVKGDPSGKEEYGLQVQNNKNLQALFTQNVTIENGNIFIQMNPNLCTNVVCGFIDDVVDSGNTSTLPANEVNANGDGPVCRGTNLETSVTNITSNTVDMELKAISYEDKDLTYSLFYVIDQNKTATKFDGRSASENGEWKMVDAYDKNFTSITITATYLNPNTEYAYFIQCYTGKKIDLGDSDFVVKDQLIATTPLKYFRTVPDPVTDMTATANGNSEIMIQWGPPIQSPSNVTKYIVTWTLIPVEEEILHIRNFCNPDPENDRFLNELENQVYVKRPWTTLRDEGAQSLLNDVVTSSEEDEEESVSQNQIQTSSPSTTVATHANDVTVSELNLNNYIEVNASTFTLTLDQLQQYSNYSITIRVCREGFHDNCYDEITIYQRTSPLEAADDVTNIAVKLLSTPNNSTTVRLTWNEPENPSDRIVTYTIRYGRVDKEYTNYEETCVPQELSEEEQSFVFTNLKNGNYVFSIAANSLAGVKGRWSKPMYFQVD